MSKDKQMKSRLKNRVKFFKNLILNSKTKIYINNKAEPENTNWYRQYITPPLLTFPSFYLIFETGIDEKSFHE